MKNSKKQYDNFKKHVLSQIFLGELLKPLKIIFLLMNIS